MPQQQRPQPRPQQRPPIQHRNQLLQICPWIQVRLQQQRRPQIRSSSARAAAAAVADAGQAKEHGTGKEWRQRVDPSTAAAKARKRAIADIVDPVSPWGSPAKVTQPLQPRCVYPGSGQQQRRFTSIAKQTATHDAAAVPVNNKQSNWSMLEGSPSGNAVEHGFSPQVMEASTRVDQARLPGKAHPTGYQDHPNWPTTLSWEFEVFLSIRWNNLFFFSFYTWCLQQFFFKRIWLQQWKTLISWFVSLSFSGYLDSIQSFAYVIQPDFRLANDDLAGECGDETLVIFYFLFPFNKRNLQIISLYSNVNAPLTLPPIVELCHSPGVHFFFILHSWYREPMLLYAYMLYSNAPLI
jgi:hypothetical protein